MKTSVGLTMIEDEYLGPIEEDSYESALTNTLSLDIDCMCPICVVDRQQRSTDVLNKLLEAYADHCTLFIEEDTVHMVSNT